MRTKRWLTCLVVVVMKKDSYGSDLLKKRLSTLNMPRDMSEFKMFGGGKHSLTLMINLL